MRLAEISIVAFIIGLTISAEMGLAGVATGTDSLTTSHENEEAINLEGLTTAEIINLRKFKAIDHYIVTSDGYILNLVEAVNPLIRENGGYLNSKETVLFSHGIQTSCRDFVVNSVGAKLKNFSHLNANSMSLEQLDLLSKEPTTSSLVFTLLNFGHHVWLLNRRGSMESRGHVNMFNSGNHSVKVHDEISAERNPQAFLELYKMAKEILSTQRTDKRSSFITELKTSFKLRKIDTINKAFWNYSLDEQARYDFPEVVSFILKSTGRSKLSVVGHSAAGAVFLMSLSMYPDLNNKSTFILKNEIEYRQSRKLSLTVYQSL